MEPASWREKARIEPVSPEAESTALSVHVPWGSSPSKALSGVAGLNVPVKGAAVEGWSWMGVSEASLNTVWQRLLPLSPARAISTAVVPWGEVSERVRSPT